MTIFEKMTDAVIRGSKENCIALARQSLKEGIEPINPNSGRFVYTTPV